MKPRLALGMALKLRDHKVITDKTKYTRKTRRDAKKEIRNG